MEKTNTEIKQIEDMAIYEYLKMKVTTRLFGNINTLDVDHIIQADVKYDHNTSKFENWKKAKCVIMDEVENSPFYNFNGNSPFYKPVNPIILHKLLDYYFGDTNGGGALEELGWDII
jgi:hypothetical protein